MNLEVAFGKDEVRDIEAGFRDFAQRGLASVSGMTGEAVSADDRESAWTALANAGWLDIARAGVGDADAMLGLILIHEELGKLASVLPVLSAHFATLLLSEDANASGVLDDICAGTAVPVSPWISATGPLSAAGGVSARGVLGADLATHALVPSGSGVKFVRLGEGDARVDATSQHSGLGVGSLSVPASASGIDFSSTVAPDAPALMMAKVLLSSTLVGLSAWMLDVSVDYAKNRVQFGVPIGTFQGIQYKVADVRLMVDQSRSVTRRSGVLVNTGSNRAYDYTETALASSLQTFRRASFEAHQILAGVGFMLEHPLHVYTFLGELFSTLFSASTEASLRERALA